MTPTPKDTNQVISHSKKQIWYGFNPDNYLKTLEPADDFTVKLGTDSSPFLDEPEGYEIILSDAVKEMEISDSIKEMGIKKPILTEDKKNLLIIAAKKVEYLIQKTAEMQKVMIGIAENEEDLGYFMKNDPELSAIAKNIEKLIDEAS